MEFQDLIKLLREHCNEYHFCKDGLKGVATATSVEDCVALLRDNLVWCFDSPYHQAIADNLENWFMLWPEAFHRCGIWVNEVPKKSGKGIMLCTREIYATIYGTNVIPVDSYQKCFVFGNMDLHVKAWHHATIYCKNPSAEVYLRDNSVGYCKGVAQIHIWNHGCCFAEASSISVTDFAEVHATNDCDVFKSSYHCGKIEQIEKFNFQ